MYQKKKRWQVISLPALLHKYHKAPTDWG